jgi:drug/metabolite transporter (DMT)-like permease
MKKKIDLAATFSLLGAVVFWSSVPLFLKYFTGYIDSWTANGIRYPFAALLYLPWLFYYRKKEFLPKKLWKLALIPSLINTIGQIFWAWTPYFIDPGLISFLIKLSPLWAVIGSFILFQNERVLIRSPNFWLGFLLAVVGFVVMILGGNYTYGKATLTGIAMIFFTSICWAGYHLSVRRNLSTLDSRTAFGMVAVLTSIGLSGCMFLFGKSEQALVIPAGISLLILLSGTIGIATAHLLFYFSIKRIGIAICASTNLASSFITAVLSRILYRESLTPIQWIAGLVLVTGGILLVRCQIHLKKESVLTQK